MTTDLALFMVFSVVVLGIALWGTTKYDNFGSDE
jgi:hypothetical protein